MARHRNVRALDYEGEYNDYYDEYSRSLEEDSCISPSTASEYLYEPESTQRFRSNLVDIDDEPEDEEKEAEEYDTSDIMDAKMYSAMEAIQDIIGEAIPEEDIIAAIKRSNYNVETALDKLLKREKPSTKVKGLEDSHVLPSASPSISKLYLALTADSNTCKPSADFYYYDYKRYMKDYLHKVASQTLVTRDTVKNKSNTSDQSNSSGGGHLTKSDSGNKLATIATGATETSKPKKPSVERTESPISIPKISKNIKLKNGDEILKLYAEKRKGSKLFLNLVIVGHVDAGKSTIMGHLLSLLGMISKKTLHRNEVDARKAGKASFLYAWILDETEEERNRGITIDFGQYRFETEHRVVTILDAPGHRDFIPNMVAGATKADFALLVVDATRGEFETGFESGGQTQEHTLLIRSLGISQLVVVVNKMDNVQFDQDRYLEIVDKLKKFLKQVGFKESTVQYIPCSGLTGANLVDPFANNICSWYTGPSLIQVIDAFEPTDRPVTKPFRMSISDIYKGQTSGVCISGKIDFGFIETNQKILLRPANEVCMIKSIISDTEMLNEAFSGDILTLNLLLPEGVEMSTGNVLCDLENPCMLATKFEARIVIFHNVENPIIKGYSVMIYSVCFNEVARISKLNSLIGKNNEVIRKNPRLLSRNNHAIVEFTTNKPVCIELYSEFKEYGRFIFRSGTSTIGAGIVTKILA